MKITLPHIAIAGLVLVLIAFQNCQNSGFQTKVDSIDQASDNVNNLNTADEVDENQQSNNKLTPTQTASATASTDCSSDSANFSAKVVNAGSDILFCQEYVLDMPSSSSRFGESYACDSSDDFKAPGSGWTYDVGNRKWTHAQVNLKNNAVYVPGTYVLVIKDAQGEIYKSNSMILKKSGSTNCFASTTATPTCYYKWEVYYADGTKQVFAGVQNTPDPANGQTCSAANEGATTTDNNMNNAQNGAKATLKCEKTCS